MGMLEHEHKQVLSEGTHVEDRGGGCEEAPYLGTGDFHMGPS